MIEIVFSEKSTHHIFLTESTRHSLISTNGFMKGQSIESIDRILLEAIYPFVSLSIESMSLSTIATSKYSSKTFESTVIGKRRKRKGRAT